MYRCLEGGAFGGSRLRIARIGGGGWCLLVVGGTGCLVGLCRVGRRGGDFGDVLGAVSYTHLDVYKRQAFDIIKHSLLNSDLF